EAAEAAPGPGSSGPVTIGDLTKLLTTGPDEPPVCAVPGPEAAYGDRSATLVTVRIDSGRKQIELATGSPAEGLRENRRLQICTAMVVAVKHSGCVHTTSNTAATGYY